MSATADTIRSAGYFGLLADLMEEIVTAQDVDAAARGILQRLIEAMQAEAATLFLLEGDYGSPQAQLVCRANVSASEITGLTMPADAGIVGRALKSNRAQLIADPAADPDFMPPIDSNFRVRTLMCAPLSVREERLGVVEVINRRGSAAAFDARDLEALEMLASAAALALSNARLAGRLMEEARMRRELELAAVVQRTLLPPEQPPAAVAHGLNRPARGVSGDFYDILPLRDGRTAFALADVSGKGMNAALIMVKAHTLFRSMGKKLHDPGLLLARIETELCETMAYGMFVTMIVGVFDPRTREVRLSNAGHEAPLLRDAQGRFHSFAAEDPPLGVICRLENRRYRQTRLTLDDGSLYLFTDGVTEGRLDDGSMLGREGLAALIERHAEENPAARIAAIAAQLTLRDEPLHDDLTLLVIESRTPQAAARRRERRRSRSSLIVDQTLAARVHQLRVVRRLVTAGARQVGASEEWARDLALAVDEACQNIIRHGYGGECDARIQLRMRRLPDRVLVELVDFAPPVDEDKCKGRRLDELRPGGLGVHFMTALTDKVRFMRPPAGAGNRLVLTKLIADRREAVRS